MTEHRLLRLVKPGETGRPYLLRVILRIIPAGPFGRAVLKLFGGTAAGQLLVVLASPILTRLYAPEDFGVLAVFVACLATITVVGALRLEFAIPLPVDDGEAANLAVASVLTLTVVTLVLTALVMWSGQAFSFAVDTPALAPIIWVLPIGLFAAGLNQVLTYWSIRSGRYGPIAKTHIYKGGGSALTQIALAAVTTGPLGLLIGDVVGRSSGTLSLAVAAWRADRHLLHEVTFRRIVAQLRRYRRFPFISSGASLLNSAGLQAPALLLAALYGPHVAGLYAIMHRVLAAPMRLLGRSISQVFVGHGARMISERDPEILNTFVTTARKLFLLGIAPLAVVAVGGPALFGVALGSEWSAAGSFARVLVLMYLIQFVVSPLSQILNMLERQDIQFLWDAARLVLAIGSLTLAAYVGASATQALFCYAAVMSAAYVTLLLLSRRVLTKQVFVWLGKPV